MKNSKYFCGIFATLFVTTTMVLLASCSQDDDYYDNSEMYTLAEEMGTRSGGNGGDPGYVGDGNDIPFLSNECGVWCILYIKKNVTNFMKNFCDYCTEIYFESKGGEKYL